jgi:hypothetical protein
MFDEILVSNWLIPLLKPSLHRILKFAKPHTMVSRQRMQNLWRLVRRIERAGVPGDFVELGVARGGTSILLCYGAMRSRFERHVWLFDAFEDFPKPDATLAEVRDRLFGDFSFDAARVHLQKCWFQDAAPAA